MELHAKWTGLLESPMPCAGHLCAFIYVVLPAHDVLLLLSIHPNLPIFKVLPNPFSCWKPVSSNQALVVFSESQQSH